MKHIYDTIGYRHGDASISKKKKKHRYGLVTTTLVNTCTLSWIHTLYVNVHAHILLQVKFLTHINHPEPQSQIIIHCQLLNIFKLVITRTYLNISTSAKFSCCHTYCIYLCHLIHLSVAA